VVLSDVTIHCQILGSMMNRKRFEGTHSLWPTSDIILTKCRVKELIKKQLGQSLFMPRL
jgi:hypothetical protein